jgi:hypothetical protein
MRSDVFRSIIRFVRVESRPTRMKQPGLDDRHRDQDGEIRQKRGDTLNKNLPKPIPSERKLWPHSDLLTVSCDQASNEYN